MKKFLLLSLVLIILYPCAFSQAINVPKSKKALLMKMTATWCGPCGYYHSITDNIYINHKDSILFINAHVSTSDVGDPYSGNFHNALNGIGEGIPSYNVNGIKQTNWPPSEKTMIDSARIFLKKPVIANIAFSYQITGSQLSVQTSVKFFASDNADEYYVNVFIVENKIPTTQKVDVTYTPLIQDRVSRGPIMSGNAGMWGEKFATGNVSSGKFYDVSFISTLKPTWVKSNLQFVAVVWKKTGTVYRVLSAEDVPSLNTGIDNTTSRSSDAIMVFPNPVSDQMNIAVNGIGLITVHNSLGQMVLHKDFKTNKEQTISINTKELESGIYFIQMIQGGKMSAQKIIIQN